MKIKIGLVIASQASLNKLLSLELPIKIAFRLNRLLKELQDPIKLAEDQRLVLVKKYGSEDEESGQVRVTEANMAEFVKQVTELHEEEIEISFKPIDVEDLGDAKLSAFEVNALESFVKFEE